MFGSVIWIGLLFLAGYFCLVIGDAVCNCVRVSVCTHKCMSADTRDVYRVV